MSPQGRSEAQELRMVVSFEMLLHAVQTADTFLVHTWLHAAGENAPKPVSYTHLTLPTTVIV